MTDEFDFDKYVQNIDRELTTFYFLADAVKFLSEKERELNNLADTYYSQVNIDTLEDSLLWVKALENITLEINMYRAIENCPEFNVEPFKSRFIECARKPGIITIRRQGNNITVDFHFDKIAGNIKDWANAVEKANQFRTNRDKKGKETGTGVGKYRKSSSGKSMVMPPAMASKMWREKYYMPARMGVPPPGKYAKNTARYVADYNETMRLRLEAMKGLAPFWSIIDKGNAVYGGGSGTPYPITKPQNFLQKVRKSLKLSFENHDAVLRSKIKNAYKELDKINRALDYIIDERKKIEDELESLNHIEVISEPVKVEDIFRDQTRKIYEQRLDERFSYVDQTRLDGLIDDIYSNLAVPKRKTIGRNPKTGNPITTRTKSLIRQAQETRKRYGY